ncbi:MAG: D-tyrosyl-tRNA(Tyr) deacylase [Bacilli bacterium]|jgi:D-tyrosyl-tRNA(Tyr) deacylase|nr:D-tyrosyl-tRNA(Tyr) deacylase [Bacilli bacterium]
MRVIVQVVEKSSVLIKDNNIKNEIGKGYNLLVGFTHSDTMKIIENMANKITNLRVITDSNGKMNLSIKDTNGEILSISQFTLYADARKGNRPGFTEAMAPDEATKMYDYFNKCLIDNGLIVKVGEFQSDMLVEIANVGPTTIILDSNELNFNK